MKTKNIIIYIVICLIVIAGLAVWSAKGFRTELQFSSRKQIALTNKTAIEKKDIENIIKEVYGDDVPRYFVQEVGNFKTEVSIVIENISEEQKNSIVEKFNEKYSTELKSEDIKINEIGFTRIKDIIKHFIVPGVVTLILITIYSLIRFRKIGLKEVVIKTIGFPLVAEVLLFSVLAICRVPFSKIVVAIAACLYVVIIAALTSHLENKRNVILNEQEVKTND